MPRPRNYAADKARWQAEQPMKQRAIYDLLKSQLPEHDKAIVGWANLLDYLHDLGVRRPNAYADVNDRQIGVWQREHGFPLVRGTMRPRPQSHTPCISTQYAVIAWLLSQPLTGPLFSVLSQDNVTQSVHLGFKPLIRSASTRGKAA